MRSGRCAANDWVLLLFLSLGYHLDGLLHCQKGVRLVLAPPFFFFWLGINLQFREYHDTAKKSRGRKEPIFC